MQLIRGEEIVTTRRVAAGPGPLVIEIAGRHERGVVDIDGDCVRVSYRGRTYVLERTHPGAVGAAAAADDVGNIESPMTGTVLDVLCADGDTVETGTPLIVVEAMKMEHRLKADGAAVVTEVLVEAGQQVDIGQTMIRLEPAQRAPEGAPE